ncbi:VPA1269 family protein [Shewanella sp. SP2S2-6]|uniref:VPA1269 family protein n=1 Tax=Shewanella sp. SP2S2-6 TaxID=3063540 RepID=UPI0028919672|nr:VPA1269 family protein [Shewanella sp. SP2S2-6]MDT3295942.1 VPA1269 family protein [Shewanella sp. SP2S2-6]
MQGKREFYSYQEALQIVRKQGFANSKEYRKFASMDSKMPSSPNSFYRDLGWINWSEFLAKKRCREDYYTYLEAQAVVQRARIVYSKQFKLWEKTDPKMPANPNYFYKNSGWINWYRFLGKPSPGEQFYSYINAQKVNKEQSLSSKKEFYKYARTDSRMPSGPAYVYKDSGWVNWYEFLNKSLPAELFHSYEYAQKIVQEQGIGNHQDFREYAKTDSKMPFSPHLVYENKGWIDWYSFWGNPRPDFYTYDEAKKVVKEHGIQSQTEYKRFARSNFKIPSTPSHIYKNTGWVDWYTFLGKMKPTHWAVSHPNIFSVMESWLLTQTGIPTKKTAINRFVSEFLIPMGIPDEPLYLLLRINRFDQDAYTRFIDGLTKTATTAYHFIISNFIGWIYEVHCFSDEDGERVALPGYRNPFDSVLAGFAETIKTSSRPAQTTKIPLGYEFILRLREFLAPALVKLCELPHLHEFFSSDWVYVDPSLIDKSDPNCVWRIKKNADRTIDGKRSVGDHPQIWSPVRFIALYTLIRMPLRGQQILWLDSGESDQIIPVRKTDGSITWQQNSGPLEGKLIGKKRPQGMIQRGYDGGAIFYVNTNKTGRDYDIPYVPDDLAYWLLLLRDWQLKYQPISEPMLWSNTKLRHEKNSKWLKAQGSQCFLFRVSHEGHPALTSTVFGSQLPRLLKEIERSGEDLAEYDSNHKRYTSAYSPHCLRVSLITSLIADGHAPLSVVSKLVGHSTIVMTIYYTKLSHEQMRKPLGEAEKRMQAEAQAREAEKIQNEGLSTCRHKLLVTDSNQMFLEPGHPKSACQVKDYGICPMSGAACYEGGDFIVDRGQEVIYAPVQVGYLGSQNCLRCRFFVTGVPFIGGLVALANEIGLEAETEQVRYKNFTRELDVLEQMAYDADKSGEPFVLELERKRAIANQQQSATKFAMLAEDYEAADNWINSCLELMNDSADPASIRLVVAGEQVEFERVLEESRSNYHLLAEICQNAIIYHSANPSRALPAIAQTIDRMADLNGLKPAMFKLTDEQKLTAVNELNAFLLARLGSWERIDELMCGELMLLDIDTHTPELKSMTKEIQAILMKMPDVRQIGGDVT